MPGAGFAPCDEIGTGAADGVLDGVGQERGQHQGDQEAQDGDMVFVAGGAREQVEAYDGEEREGARVEDIPGNGDALDFGVGEGDGQVVDEEETVEGLDEEDDLREEDRVSIFGGDGMEWVSERPTRVYATARTTKPR